MDPRNRRLTAKITFRHLKPKGDDQKRGSTPQIVGRRQKSNFDDRKRGPTPKITCRRSGRYSKPKVDVQIRGSTPKIAGRRSKPKINDQKWGSMPIHYGSTPETEGRRSKTRVRCRKLRGNAQVDAQNKSSTFENEDWRRNLRIDTGAKATVWRFLTLNITPLKSIGTCRDTLDIIDILTASSLLVRLLLNLIAEINIIGKILSVGWVLKVCRAHLNYKWQNVLSMFGTFSLTRKIVHALRHTYIE